MIPKLESNRLTCQRLTLQHLSHEYLGWLNDPDVNRFLETGPGYTMDALREYLLSVESNPNMLFWAIHLRSNNAHIGNIKIDPINVRHGLGEYGILIGDKKAWGKGYAREVSELVIDYCFKQRNLRKLTLGVVAMNTAAVRLYTSMGFKTEGIYVKHGLYDGEYMDVVRMALFNPAQL